MRKENTSPLSPPSDIEKTWIHRDFFADGSKTPVATAAKICILVTPALINEWRNIDSETTTFAEPGGKPISSLSRSINVPRVRVCSYEHRGREYVFSLSEIADEDAISWYSLLLYQVKKRGGKQAWLIILHFLGFICFFFLYLSSEHSLISSRPLGLPHPPGGLTSNVRNSVGAV